MQRDSGLAEIYVQPGESHLTTEPAVLRTLLGSCVAVAFLASRRGVGALCHPMLPVCPEKLRKEINSKAGQRYVDFAIRSLGKRFNELGIQREDVTVKLFGGADVLNVSASASRSSVGRLNSETALRVLREEGFTVAASSLGGDSGLTLWFDTSTGEVLVKRLRRGKA
ncbi:MAG TPA: chemotaxis protein CheD [Terracidiphilus sp.]|nr:chemotaxis protein CheD [Terracidiphilus sp.]